MSGAKGSSRFSSRKCYQTHIVFFYIVRSQILIDLIRRNKCDVATLKAYLSPVPNSSAHNCLEKRTCDFTRIYSRMIRLFVKMLGGLTCWIDAIGGLMDARYQERGVALHCFKERLLATVVKMQNGGNLILCPSEKTRYSHVFSRGTISAHIASNILSTIMTMTLSHTRYTHKRRQKKTQMICVEWVKPPTKNADYVTINPEKVLNGPHKKRPSTPESHT